MASRNRGFAFILYPDSAPVNWRSIIDDFHIAWAESPLHCFDVNEGTGELKKPHWHIVLSFDSVKSIDQVKKLIEPLNCSIPIPVNSIRGMVRYFAHLDNPEKYQYPVEQIIGHGGMDLQDLLRMSASARYATTRKMIQYIRDKNITNYMEFLDYCMEEHFEDWFPLLCDGSTYIIVQCIKAQRQYCVDERRRLEEYV